jgi:hypothetical protein
MIEPKDILLYTGAALAAYLIYKGIRSQSARYEEAEEASRKKRLEKTSSEEVKKTSEFMLSWKDPNTGKTRIANLDTMALYLQSAIRGSWFGEDEEQIKSVMNLIPVSVKGKSGISYPIRIIAIRYQINTNGKNLKADLTKYLSASELINLGVSKHLKYL